MPKSKLRGVFHSVGIPEEGKGVRMIENLWADPQLVFMVYADQAEELPLLLEGAFDDMLARIYAYEDPRIKKFLYRDGRDAKIEKGLKDKFGIHVRIPADYEEVIRDEQVLWIKSEFKEATANIVFAHVDGNVPLQVRNDLMGEYVSSELKDSYMISDTSVVGILQGHRPFGNWDAVETRGLWKMAKGFMGGPYLNYLIRQDDGWLMVDAFLYAPGTDKRQLMRHLETICSTIQASDKQ
jgi:hypothetical protein